MTLRGGADFKVVAAQYAHMHNDIPVETRWLFSALATVVVAGLIYSGAVEPELGLTVMVGLFSSLGLYERRERRVLERKGVQRQGTGEMSRRVPEDEDEVPECDDPLCIRHGYGTRECVYFRDG